MDIGLHGNNGVCGCHGNNGRLEHIHNQWSLFYRFATPAHSSPILKVIVVSNNMLYEVLVQ